MGENFRDLFDSYDKDKSGLIDCMELQRILKEFDWEPKTREEQATLMKTLDVARASTREAGIQQCTKDGSSDITFWEFVQLCRILRTKHERAEEQRMAALMADLKFTQTEVDQFREIFHNWINRERMVNEASGSCAVDAKGPDALTQDALKRLVRTLGLSISPEDGDRMVKQFADHEESTGGLGFAGFLHLMRWMLDTDFVSIKEATEKQARP